MSRCVLCVCVLCVCSIIRIYLPQPQSKRSSFAVCLSSRSRAAAMASLGHGTCRRLRRPAAADPAADGHADGGGAGAGAAPIPAHRPSRQAPPPRPACPCADGGGAGAGAAAIPAHRPSRTSTTLCAGAVVREPTPCRTWSLNTAPPFPLALRKAAAQAQSWAAAPRRCAPRTPRSAARPRCTRRAATSWTRGGRVLTGRAPGGGCRGSRSWRWSRRDCLN